MTCRQGGCGKSGFIGPSVMVMDGVQATEQIRADCPETRVLVKAYGEEDRMSETYNRKQAMERLGILSINSFLFLQRKYPDAFVVVNQGTAADKKPLYD